MTDPLDNIQRRLGWINRGLILAALVIVVALIAFVVHRLRTPAPPSTVKVAVQPASAARATASAPAAASQPATPASRAASAPALPQMQQTAPATASQAASRTASQTASQPVSMQAASQPAMSASGAGAAQPAAAASMAATAAAPMPTRTAPPARVRHERPEHHAAGHARVVRRAHATAAAGLCSRTAWYVQVGAFSEASSFDHLSARLQHFGIPHCRSPRSPRGLHVLLVGPYATRAEAEHMRSRLKPSLRKASYLRHLVHGKA